MLSNKIMAQTGFEEYRTLTTISEKFTESDDISEQISEADEHISWINEHGQDINSLVLAVNKEYMRIKTHMLSDDKKYKYDYYTMRFNMLCSELLAVISEKYREYKQVPSTKYKYDEYVLRVGAYTKDTIINWFEEWDSDYEWLRYVIEHEDYSHIIQAAANIFQLSSNLYIQFPREDFCK